MRCPNIHVESVPDTFSAPPGGSTTVERYEYVKKSVGQLKTDAVEHTVMRILAELGSDALAATGP